MNVISKNNEMTVGIISDVSGLKNVGDFSVKFLEEWIKKSKLILGDESDLRIEFKLADNPDMPGYLILASHNGEDPKVVVCGKIRDDKKPWADEH